jgi:long-chain fatty acid transport protein
MGGASFAYYNGNAGMINNPATLGMMPNGTSRLDVAIGGLHPDITTSAGSMSIDSGSTAFYMPAIGYARKDGALAWGVGMMAQGGMGTSYGSNSLMSGYTSMTTMSSGMTGQDSRSELGIGRVLFPASYDVSNTLKIGGSVDFLWGGLDLNMGLDGNMFGQMLAGGKVSGTMVQGLGGMINTGLGGGCAAPAPGCINDVNWAHFGFSEGRNGMKQQTSTTGWAGNLGFVWQASPQLSVGGIYHAKTSLKDMKGDATMLMNVKMGAPGAANVGVGADTQMAVTGMVKIVNFQWPETYGIGMSYQASNALMIVADYKRIVWSKVMKAFNMSFTADSGAANSAMGFAGAVLNATLDQNWDDQDVFMLGGSYQLSEPVTLRAGINVANNPVPDSLMNPLFPATIKNHFTVGMGYALDKKASVDFSLTLAPEVSATNGMGVKTTHSQTNWQLMYSNRF